MDKEFSGSQTDASGGGDNQNATPQGFVDLDAMLQQSNGGPPLPVADSQNAQVAAAPPQNNSTQGQKIKGWLPEIADDTDLIEKEWVEKAREIVEHTSNDPHAQNEQLSELKAEYLKKRYDKVIRPSGT